MESSTSQRRSSGRNSGQQWGRRLAGPLIGVTAALLVPMAWITGVRADGPATTTAPSPRTTENIIWDMQAANNQLAEVADSPNKLINDDQVRKELAPKVVPLIRKLLNYADELAAANPEYKEPMAVQKSEYSVLLAFLGDQQAADHLLQDSQSKDSAVALSGKIGQLRVQWLKNLKDVPAEAAVLDQMQELARTNPNSDPLAGALMTLFQQTQNVDLGNRINKILDGMTSVVAKQASAELGADQKLRALIDKPLELAGPSADGKEFSTASWKGKVILVDFWATWCGPCREELPRVQKVYSDFHTKGLEVLGISCDNTADALTKFLQENAKEMPWPQLFDAKEPGWHPLAKKFGIDSIPRMFLIDKKGVCRSVDAREDFEKQIPKLLDEK